MAAVEESSPIDDLPVELVMEILSRLSWRQQLGVRSVSRRWQAAVDACLARRQELHDSFSGRGILDKVINLLQKMPALRRLWLNILDDISILCPEAVEVMCSSCSLLQELHLYFYLEDDAVKTLLSLLPDLRVLHLPCFWLGSSDVLSLLPTGLKSLSLGCSEDSELAAFLPLKRCPQLRELQLREVAVEGLREALAACPQLERLTVVDLPPDSDWCSALALCPHLGELHVVGKYRHLSIDLFTVLTACERLERLSLHDCSISLPSPDHLATNRHKFGLSQLYVYDLEMDDATFCRLARLLPGLIFLGLDADELLTEEGLASGIQCFTDLQVLELRCEVSLSAASPVLDLLSSLPLKALSCTAILYAHREAVIPAPCLAALLQHSPSLTLLHVQASEPDFLRCFVDALEGDSLERDITLVFNRDVPSGPARLPRSIRVLRYEPDVWSELTGWRLRGICRFCHDLLYC